MINVWDYNDCDHIRVICVDGQVLQGRLSSIDDEEDSGFDEDGISIIQDNGGYVGVPESEIREIVVLD